MAVFPRRIWVIPPERGLPEPIRRIRGFLKDNWLQEIAEGEECREWLARLLPCVNQGGLTMISTLLPIMSAIVILATAVLTAVLLVRRYLRVRGPRVVSCPADDSRACVEVSALRSVLSGSDPESFQLSSCSHWPERAGCGQECLEQLATSPDGCLVRNILADWYESKTCILCGKPFGQIDWMEHKPCLMAPDRITKDWSKIRPLDLSETLATHLPVCWNCHIAVTFRRQYPELVTDRPWKR